MYSCREHVLRKVDRQVGAGAVRFCHSFKGESRTRLPLAVQARLMIQCSQTRDTQFPSWIGRRPGLILARVLSKELSLRLQRAPSKPP